MSVRYMTDAQVAQLGFADLDTAAQAVSDADAVYEFVANSPAATSSDLDQYAIAQWGSGDARGRLEGALRVLGLQGRLVQVGG